MNLSRRNLIKSGIAAGFVAGLGIPLIDSAPMAKHPFLCWVAEVCDNRVDALYLIREHGYEVHWGNITAWFKSLIKDDQDSKFMRWLKDDGKTLVSEEYQSYKLNGPDEKLREQRMRPLIDYAVKRFG